jgi:CAAX protease family protein
MATAAPVQPAAPHRGFKVLLVRHPLVSFFVMAYAFSWIVWAPWVLGEDGARLLPSAWTGPLSGLLLPAGILAGPTLSAFIMTGVTEGRSGVRRLLGRYVLWRVGIRWYLFALLGIPLLMVLGTMIVSGDLPNLGALGGLSFVPGYLVFFMLVLLIGGPLLEEGGWRGFALPRMQPLYGPLVASLILGVLWALWHLPEFLVSTWAAPSGGASILGITQFVVIAVAIAIMMTWLFNNTRGSLLLAVLAHTSIDATGRPLGEIFPPAAASSSLSLLVGLGALALVLIALTLGRLGYRPEAEAALTDASAVPPVR